MGTQEGSLRAWSFSIKDTPMQLNYIYSDGGLAYEFQEKLVLRHSLLFLNLTRLKRENLRFSGRICQWPSLLDEYSGSL